MCEKNSCLVFASSLKTPRTEEVEVEDVVFCTPRIAMHMCFASITTATPRGRSTSQIACAICFPRRSCTWRLRTRGEERRGEEMEGGGEVARERGNKSTRESIVANERKSTSASNQHRHRHQQRQRHAATHRRAYSSTMRANLDKPMIVPLGM